MSEKKKGPQLVVSNEEPQKPVLERATATLLALESEAAILRAKLEKKPETDSLTIIREVAAERRPFLAALDELDKNHFALSELLRWCEAGNEHAIGIFTGGRFHQGVGILQGLATVVETEASPEAWALAGRIRTLAEELLEYGQELNDRLRTEDAEE